MKSAREKTFSPVRIAASSCPSSGFGTVRKGGRLQVIKVFRNLYTVNHYLFWTLPFTAYAGILALDNKSRK